MSTSRKIVLKFYPNAFSLLEYLQQIVADVQISRPEDGPSFLDFLESTIVAFQQGASDPHLKFTVYECDSNHQEILERVQRKLLTSRFKNLLTLGSRLSDPRDECSGMVVNYIINPHMETLRESNWKLLHERIGHNPFFYLLTKTSIFTPLPNNCLSQISGEPIFDLKPIPNQTPASTSNPVSRKRKGNPSNSGGGALRKRARVENAPAPTSRPARPSRVTPADIMLSRVRMFYTQPSKAPGGITIGLPPNHVLSLVSSWYDLSNVAPGTQSALAYVARHISKHIFPLQYGLPNVFADKQDNRHSVLKGDFLEKEEDVKKLGPCKTPKRIKPVIPVLQKLAKLHSKCDYRMLCNLICPSKLTHLTKPDKLDPDLILELISDVPGAVSQLNDRTLDVSHASLVVPEGSPEGKRLATVKPKFADYVCSSNEVYRYMRAVTLAVFPHDLWGSPSNFSIMMDHVKTFIVSRRYDILTLHNVLQGFAVADCDWTLPSGEKAESQRVNITNDLKRRELASEFLHWYFEHFLIPLLRTTFYITESTAFRNQTLYVRHDDWEALCKPILGRISGDTFARMEMSQNRVQYVLNNRRLGYARVRLLPKDTGVRPIVNLRRKTSKGASINQVLQSAFQILTLEKKSQPDLLGASVFGPNEIYTQLKAYRSRIKSNIQTLPKLYFVKVDVRAAFDTINQGKLLEILREFLSEDEYTIRKYVRVSSAGGNLKKIFQKKAFPEWDQTQFTNFAEQLAGSLRNAIFVDQVTYMTENRENILGLLEEHVKDNLVKMGSSFYRQTIGIPQGSVLSTLLCSFFYGDLERRNFDFRKDLQNLLLRYVDDYLFITTQKSVALNFLDIMNEGHPEYGCFISKEKTLTNFDCDKHHPNVITPGQRDFPWCGLLIDTERLHIKADYTRLNDIHISSILTVDRGRNPGLKFMQKMLRAGKLRCHIIYNDTSLNSRTVVFINSYQNFAITAMKMHNYIKSCGLNSTGNFEFILNVIYETIRGSFVSIARNIVGDVGKRNSASYSIDKTSIRWLGLHAFHRIFSQKPSAYHRLIASLQAEMEKPGYALARKRLQRVVVDGFRDLQGIQF